MMGRVASDFSGRTCLPWKNQPARGGKCNERAHRWWAGKMLIVGMISKSAPPSEVTYSHTFAQDEAHLESVSVMKSQVGCTTVRLICDNKSIKTIMIPRTSYQTSTNKTKPRDASYLWQSFISTIVYRLVLNNLEAAGAFRSSRFIYVYHLPRWYVYPRFLKL